MPDTPPRVLISYSHDSPEHEANVLALADRLRADGIDCRLDQYEPWPKEGWSLWMQREIDAADLVVLICTETYHRRVNGDEEPGRGLGACWEGGIIRTQLMGAGRNNERFIAALPENGQTEHVPSWLRDYTYFAPFNDEGYEQLYRRLTAQPAVPMPALGARRELTPVAKRERHPDFGAVPVWIIPHAPTPFFTGREDTLKKLREELDHSGRVALCGLGGMGKTETARMYVQRHRDAHPYVFWISAASQDELLAGYGAIAAELALPLAGDNDANAVAQAAIRWLNSHESWLLVIDNADEPKLLSGLLPARGKGHLLITMRPLFTGELASRVEIEPLPDEDGALLLLRRAGILAGNAGSPTARPADLEAARELWHAVGGLPLALDQAGAYLEEMETSPERYLSLFRANGKRLLERRGGYDAEHFSVAVTFSVAHDKLAAASAEAADLLRLCAFLAPDAIPEELLDHGASVLGETLGSAVADELARDELIHHARRFALLRRNREVRTLTVHRLVQDVIREGMTDEEQRRWAERAVRAASVSFPDVEYETWPACRLLLPHADICSSWIERWQLVSPEAALLLNGSVEFLTGLARYAEAEALVERALSISEKSLGPDHPTTARSLNNQARLLEFRGQFAAAEPLLRRVLAIVEKSLGRDHPTTAAILNNLAESLREQNRHAEAEPLYRRALAIREELPGPDHPDTATTLSNLALGLHAQGKHHEAESLDRRALAIREAKLGPNHPSTAISLSNLAGLLQRQGQYVEAEPLHRRALGIRETALGPDHPDTATGLNNLAGLLLQTERSASAAPLFRKALLILERAHGPHHPRIAATLYNLATALRHMGRNKEARPLEVRARKIREQHARENAAPAAPDAAPSASSQPETEA